MSCSLFESDELLEEESSAESADSAGSSTTGAWADATGWESSNKDAVAAVLFVVLKKAGTATVSTGNCTVSSSAGAVAPRSWGVSGRHWAWMTS